ncbi:C-type lectin domain-containing protein [Nocardia sp. CA-128927]|uniref:C-type lectin domain-containing protein n=1 Tax=Nocardia sp. CA-128927 TaxID=3239975 RepID=UPI003D9928E4
MANHAPGTGTQVGNFWVSSSPSDWQNAKAYCDKAGMKLVSIETADKNAELLKVLDSLGVDRVWTSGTDAPSDGNYMWASTGAPFDYTNWARGVTPRHASDNYVYLGTSTYFGNGRSGWDVANGEDALRFIGE